MNRIARLILALGAIFVGGVAVSACGSAVPGDSVAVVAGNPITKQTFAHWAYIAAVGQAAQNPGAPLIVPDPPNYTKCIGELRKTVPTSITTAQIKTACQSSFASTMEYLIRAYWVQGQAAAQGIKASTAQVTKNFDNAKNGQFKTPAAFQQFLTQTGQTEADILYRFRVTLLSTKLANAAAIKAYYDSHRASYSTPERRNIRIILTKTLAGANAAKAALQHHQSWQVVAKKYSIDTATKNTGGMLSGVTNGEEPQALNSVIFSAQSGVLLGPIKSPFGYYVAEVTNIYPASQQTLAQVTPAIKSMLEQNALSNPTWQKKWKAKTTCRAGFEIPDCSNYQAPKATTTTTTAGGTAGSPATTPSTGSTTPSAGSTTPATGTTTTSKK